MPTQVLWRSDPHDRQGVSDSHAHVAIVRLLWLGLLSFTDLKKLKNMKKKNTPLNRFDPGTPASKAVDITTTLQYLLT